MLHDSGPRGPRKGAKRRGFGRLRKLPSGRWQAAYTGPDGVLYTAATTFDYEDAARGWLSRERRLIEADEWTSPESRRRTVTARGRTLAAYADLWLDQRTIKPRTRTHYRSLLDHQILPALGSLTLKGITPEAVRAWHAGMGKATPTLRAHAYGLLRTILGSAVEDELIRVNPCHIRGAGNAKRVHQIKPASVEELSLIVDNMPPRYRLMVLLASWCGLRFGELAELRRSDIDVANRRVKIRRGVVRAAGETIVGSPKTAAGVRDVAIPPHLMPMVEEHLAAYTARARNGLLFPAATGGNLAPSSLYRVFYPAREAAGRPDLRWHDLRHTGAVLAAQTGATLAELMARLGHSTPGAAMRYQHAAQDRDAEIARRLSELVGDKRTY